MSRLTMSNNQATATAVGEARVNASLAGITASLDVQVSNPFVGIVYLNPAVSVIEIGSTQQFQVLVIYDSGTYDISEYFTWTSSNTSVATINSSGLATGLAFGIVAITAHSIWGNVSGILAVVPTMLTITPDTASVKNYEEVNFTASGGIIPHSWNIDTNASNAVIFPDNTECEYIAGEGTGLDEVVVTDTISWKDPVSLITYTVPLTATATVDVSLRDARPHGGTGGGGDSEEIYYGENAAGNIWAVSK